MSLENGRDLFFWPIYFKGTNIMGIIAKQFRRVEQIGSLCVSHSLKLVSSAHSIDSQYIGSVE